MGSIPVQAWIFVQVSFFSTAKVETPSLRWSSHNFIFIRSSNIWISYINVHLLSIYVRDKYELSIDQLPVGLIAKLVGALHRYRRGHGYDSRASLNFFFQVSSFQPLRLKHLHCDDLHIILKSVLWGNPRVSHVQPEVNLPVCLPCFEQPDLNQGLTNQRLRNLTPGYINPSFGQPGPDG